MKTFGDDFVTSMLAFPVDEKGNPLRSNGNIATTVNMPGLTKREYFAAMAMQGIISTLHNGYMAHEDVADYAIKAADALIIGLNKK